MNKFMVGIGCLMQIVGVSGLTYIALKRNRDAHKARMECLDARMELAKVNVENLIKDCEIAILNAEINQLKEGEKTVEES